MPQGLAEMLSRYRKVPGSDKPSWHSQGADGRSRDLIREPRTCHSWNQLEWEREMERAEAQRLQDSMP